jgi:hypothetical protein
MIIILGLIVLVAVLVVGVAGVLGNGGSAHAVSHFAVLGYHLTGSAGTLFLAGIVVGAAGLLGLGLVLAGARRASRRGRASRRVLQQSRRETAAVSQERDDLIDQRDTARAQADSRPGIGTDIPDALPTQASGRRSGLRNLGRRLTSPQAGAHPDLPAADESASSSGPVVTATSAASDTTPGVSDPDVAAIDPALDAHATAPGPAQ